MKAKKIFSVILSAVMTVSCLPLTAYAVETDEPEYVEGEIIISTKKEVEDTYGMLQTASDSDTVGLDFEDVGITDIEKVEIYSEDENVYLAEVDGDVEKICAELSESDDIIAEPNYILHTCGFTMPYEINNNIFIYNDYQKWYLDTILKLPDALETHEVTGEGVTIAIIDDGYNLNATDFPVHLWKNSRGTVGWNVHSDNDDISPIYKSDGSAFVNTSHGSNVAGLIGMASNRTGGIGVAYGAELMLIQAANYSSDSTNPGFTSTDIVKAIDFARTNEADIINLSLGVAQNITSIKSAITRAYNAGIAIFAAAGNENKSTSASSNVFYPAGYSNVIGVMAIGKTNTGKLASFSNYDVSGKGTYYNIAAPGEAIVGCGLTAGSYTPNNGTSQAAPLVAAAAALYYEKYPNKTVQDLYSDLLASATDTVTAYSSTTYKYKSLNILKLLDYCMPPEINANLSTDATVDRGYFYGLDEGYDDINDYLSVTNGYFTFTPSANGNGTGSTINVYFEDGELYKVLNVVIFGDINGDGFADAQDAVLANCIKSGLGSFSTTQSYAADVTFDSNCDDYDIEMIEKYAIFTDNISQIR